MKCKRSGRMANTSAATDDGQCPAAAHCENRYFDLARSNRTSSKEFID
jgi:hypothetical protein